MVYNLTHWRCETCHTSYSSFDEARACELRHITQESIDQLKIDLARIFEEEAGKRRPRARSKRKALQGVRP